MLASRFGFDVPARMFFTFHEQLKTIYVKYLDLSEEIANSLADVLEQEAVELARIHYDDYRAALGRSRFDEAKLKKNLRAGLELPLSIDTGY